MGRNPYNYTIPIKNSAMFFGRGDIVESVIRGVNSIEGDSFAIVGGRRMGKTSLLLELERRLRKSPDTSDDLKVLPVYLDLSYIVPPSRRSLCTAIFRKARETLQQNLEVQIEGDGETLFDQSRPDDDAVQDFEKALGSVVNGFPYGLIRVVLLIDEVEYMLTRTWSQDLLSQLRSLITNSPVDRNLALVAAGSSDLYTEVETRREISPLANALRSRFLLKVLSKADTASLIDKPAVDLLGGPLPVSTKKEIYSQSGGHPFLVQYLMANILEEKREDTSESDVRDIASRFMTERNDFANWLGRFSEIEGQVYSLLIEKAGLTWDQIKDSFGATSGSKAIDILSYTGVIRDEEGKYVVSGTMFKDWFIEQKEAFFSFSEEMQQVVEEKSPESIIRIYCFNFGCPQVHPRCAETEKTQRKYNPRNVFVAIPYKDYYQDYREAIEQVIRVAGLKPVIVDYDIRSFHILCKVCRNIRQSEYGVADVSHFNPNIMYELGFMQALNKRCAILLEREGTTPTDLQGLEYLSYSNTGELKEKLGFWLLDNVKVEVDQEAILELIEENRVGDLRRRMREHKERLG